MHNTILLLVVAGLLFPNLLRLTSATKIEIQMCGFEQKCSENITAIRNVDSCCRPCECAGICKEKDTCCSDMEGRNETEDKTKQECLPAYFSLRFDARKFDDVPKYFTRSSCPKTFKDLKIKESCENSTSKSLEDISFASSVDGTVVFKNRFCGICHGENSTVLWKEMIQASRCDTNWLNVNVNASSVNDFVIDKCPLHFKPPDNLELRSVTCFPKVNVINKCNQTKQWDVYDKKLETQCIHTPESLYYVSLSISTWIYSNVYCYLCNTNPKIEPATCKDFYNSIRFRGVSLFTLINTHIWKGSGNIDANMLTEKNACMKEEILDTFFNMCRKLYCPALSVPVNGKCVLYMHGDICYVLIVNLTPLDTVLLTESLKRDLKASFLAIKKQLGFGKCQSWQEHMLLKTGRDKMGLSTLQVKLLLNPSKGCRMLYLWSTIERIQTLPTYIGIMLAENMTDFRAVWASLPQKPGEFQSLYHVQKPLLCLQIKLQLGSTCPRIKLTKEEHELVVQRHAAADKLLFAPVENESNDTVFVCCDKYITEALATGQETKENYINILLALISAILNYWF